MRTRAGDRRSTSGARPIHLLAPAPRQASSVYGKRAMPKPASVVAQPPIEVHQALYRRWRSQRFGEVLGQDAIVATLQRAVASDRLAHAYLFVGPRGTGKTSTARILAKAINCTARGADGEPCDACAACTSIREGRALDVIEIDAASHGLVEDARDLVMRALTSPSELRKRVYIIDEVHMLSTHAFNALLKLVEEPPEHVVFILATTDTHKVPATMISRTQRFDFRRLPDAAIVGKLARICASEQTQADTDALALLARLAEGGMRDAESMLDQVLAFVDGHVTADAVREAVGLADEAVIGDLVDAFVAGDARLALDRVEALADIGRDMAQVAAQAEAETRRRLIAAAGDPALARRLAVILRSVAEAGGASGREGRARLLMELLAVESPSTPPVQLPKPLASSAPTAEAPRQRTSVTPRAPHEPAPPPAPTPMPASNGRPGAAELRARWAEVVERATPVIKPLLRECRPVAVEGARLTLAFPEGRDFMRSRIEQRAAPIEQLLEMLFGGTWAIECVASNVELEPLSVEQAVAPDRDDADAMALLEGVLKITGGELVDVHEVRS